SRVLFDFRFGYVATATRPQLKSKIPPRYATSALTFIMGQALKQFLRNKKKEPIICIIINLM
ncbi:MAG: hypothetical protein UH625_04635, partial [Muribaculaceae bacterium]|nr:hypothetical protein [Muribaculaceae bacterium]